MRPGNAFALRDDDDARKSGPNTINHRPSFFLADLIILYRRISRAARLAPEKENRNRLYFRRIRESPRRSRFKIPRSVPARPGGCVANARTNHGQRLSPPTGGLWRSGLFAAPRQPSLSNCRRSFSASSTCVHQSNPAAPSTSSFWSRGRDRRSQISSLKSLLKP